MQRYVFSTATHTSTMDKNMFPQFEAHLTIFSKLLLTPCKVYTQYLTGLQDLQYIYKSKIQKSHCKTKTRYNNISQNRGVEH